jgi:MFS family permease
MSQPAQSTSPHLKTLSRDPTAEPVEPENLTTGPTQRHRTPLFALFGGNAISMIGNGITAIAIPWFVLETTGSAAKTGLVGFAGMLPFVLAGFFGGAIVDRLGHKRASVIADIASGITVGMIPLLYHTVGLAFWELIVLVFLGALLDTPGRTARVALMPNLAARAAVSLERVNAADQMLNSATLLVGPTLAGLLIALLGTSNVLWLDAASFAVSALLIASLVPPPPFVKEDRTTSYLEEVREGLRFIRDDNLLRAILAPATVVNFLMTPLFGVVLPVYAARTYGNAVAYGALIAGFGGGTLAGSIVYGVVVERLPKRVTTVAAFALGGSPIWILAFQPSLPISIGLIALTGLALSPLNPIVGTVLLKRTPERLRGRVLGAVTSLATILSPLGIITFGFALDWAGLGIALIGISAGLMLVGLYVAREPAFKELDARNNVLSGVQIRNL